MNEEEKLGIKIVMKLNHEINSEQVVFKRNDHKDGNALRQFDDAVDEVFAGVKQMLKENKFLYGVLWIRCPICNGQGLVSKPPHIPGDVNQWTSSQGQYQCDVCKGEKIISNTTGLPPNIIPNATVAIGFAEWIKANRYERSKIDDTWWQISKPEKRYSSYELFEIYSDATKYSDTMSHVIF